MNGFEFVADLTGSLAWPAAIVFIAWLLRDEIGQIVQHFFPK